MLDEFISDTLLKRYIIRSWRFVKRVVLHSASGHSMLVYVLIALSSAYAVFGSEVVSDTTISGRLGSSTEKVATLADMGNIRVSAVFSKYAVEEARVGLDNFGSVKFIPAVGKVYSSDKKYIIQKGDTLGGLANAFKISTARLLEYNPSLKKTLRIGAVLNIPGKVSENAMQLASGELTFLPIDEQSVINELAMIDEEPVSFSEQGGFAGTVENNNSLPADGWLWSYGYNADLFMITNFCGTDVSAAEDGLVIESSDNGYANNGLGNYVIIESKNGARLLYANTENHRVFPGMEVEKGDVIAVMGRAVGSTTYKGCRVLFGIYDK